MENARKTDIVLFGLAGAFLVLTAAFASDILGSSKSPPPIPLVDPAVLDVTPVRTSYADLARAGEDVSDFDCLMCHEKDEPPVLQYDDRGRVIIPSMHDNIVLGHGTHGRNNNCYNCHNQDNLATLSARKGRELGFAESSQLCGSCHGPIMSDWDSGGHGRISGHWDLERGAAVKLDCVNCHDPHSPKFPGRKPAPGPHSLHTEITSGDH